MTTGVGWGIIGSGDVVRRKSGPAFTRVEGAGLRAVAGRNAERAASVARELGAGRACSSPGALIADPEVDAVYVATPPGTRAEIALARARAGKPVYLEKPLARTHAETLAIVEGFERAGVELFVAHYRRALPRSLELGELIAAGAIGRPIRADLTLERTAAETAGHPWMFDTALSGGGRFIDLAPHTIDILVFLLGKFARVEGRGRNAGSPHGREDVVTMSFETAGGTLGTANFNFVSDRERDAAVLHGTAGRLEFSVHDEAPVILSDANGVHTFDLPTPRYIQEPMIAEVTKHSLGLGGTPCFGREALETARVIDAVQAGFELSRAALKPRATGAVRRIRPGNGRGGAEGTPPLETRTP